MCGRYVSPDQAALERYWNLCSSGVQWSASYNVCPSQEVPVLRLDEHGIRDLSVLEWGFQPAWAKKSWINARSETVFTSKAFSSSARKRRCLVPAIAWYEWKKLPEQKQPYIFHLDGFKPFAFAGIWTSRPTDNGLSRSFAILTKPALERLADIHHRMPVLISPENYDSWMSGGTSIEIAQKMVDENDDKVSTYPVSTYVNHPANNDARCIKPIA